MKDTNRNKCQLINTSVEYRIQLLASREQVELDRLASHQDFKQIQILLGRAIVFG
jgi:hypothetical protein